MKVSQRTVRYTVFRVYCIKNSGHVVFKLERELIYFYFIIIFSTFFFNKFVIVMFLVIMLLIVLVFENLNFMGLHTF